MPAIQSFCKMVRMTKENNIDGEAYHRPLGSDHCCQSAHEAMTTMRRVKPIL